MQFPAGRDTATTLLLEAGADGLPVVRRLGVALPDESDAHAALAAAAPGVPLLLEPWRAGEARPGLRGHRVGAGLDAVDGGLATGRSWATAFTDARLTTHADRLVVDATDVEAGLALRTEVEALPGGALRVRHRLTNTAPGTYLVEALEVSVPLPDTATELLDFTGRHERERSPQRRAVTDGTWLRESRAGRPGLGSATTLIAGEPGFGFGHSEVVGAAVACTGNSALAVHRDPKLGTVLFGGELLLPGEVALGTGESYTSPWLVLTAGKGLDELAARLHEWQRSLPAHPAEQPVTLNVWEAVYFDHDQDRLLQLAELAARVGVERFVLDDGWFLGRRHDRAGLGDWQVDPDVWPQGLGPLIERVHALGMQFGLWVEPEMVNPDSDLLRAHPDWVLAANPLRLPPPERNQQVLDLTRPEAFEHVLARLDAVLSENAVDYVKWDHNRALLEAGSLAAGGRPAVHAQSRAFLRLLDALRARHPHVQWESCASGGGRIDLEVVEHVQRCWTSDMTDALSRQAIQRWTTQLVAPEYLGAHVSAPVSHQTGRAMPLDFRCATALFGSFGIEWDLTTAADDELARLADWCARYRELRGLLHTGRVVRLDVTDPAVLAHGVVSPDRRRALLAHVQLDESVSNRGVSLRVPGLDPSARYRARWVGPVATAAASHSSALPEIGPTGGTEVSGAVLAQVGIWIPRRRPLTATLFSLDAVRPGDAPDDEPGDGQSRSS